MKQRKKNSKRANNARIKMVDRENKALKNDQKRTLVAESSDGKRWQDESIKYTIHTHNQKMKIKMKEQEKSKIIS